MRDPYQLCRRARSGDHIVLYSQPHVASHSDLTTLFKQEEDREERPLAEIYADLAENLGLKFT